MSVRTDLADLLRARWADVPELAGVRLTATNRALDEIRHPTAIVRQVRIGRAAAAPMSYWQVDMLLTIVSPYQDLDRAGDQLDELVPAALTDLDALGIRHDEAEQVAYAERLAYDVPLTVYSPKETN